MRLSAVVAAFLVVGSLVSSCAHRTAGAVAAHQHSSRSAPEAALSATSRTTVTSGAPRPSEPPDKGTTTYQGLIRVASVRRSCVSPFPVEVAFKVGSLLIRRARLVATDHQGRVLQSTVHTLPVVSTVSGDGGMLVRGTRATWTLATVAGRAVPDHESSGWTVSLVPEGSSRALSRPMSFTMPSCADGSWRAPSLSVAIDEVRRDCTAPSPANEYVTARIRATGLVYGLGYEVRGTVLGETVNNLPPFGTTVDRAVTLSPAPDQRSGAGPPTPFPSSAFTATVQLVGEPADDWFTRDERSAGVPVAVPACQPGSSAGPAPASPWSRRRPVLPTR